MRRRDRTSWKCHYCGLRFPAAEITRDHVIPKSRGGRTNTRNLVPACLPCNQRKGSKFPTCNCPACVDAYQYHRNLIETIRTFSESWANEMLTLLGPEGRVMVYGIMTEPSPAELGDVVTTAHLIRNMQ